MNDNNEPEPATERQPLVLMLITKGTPDAPRWAIADQYMRCWNGTEFVKESKDHKPILYCSTNAAAEEAHKLLKHNYEGRLTLNYVAPIYLELRTTHPVTFEEVQAWLIKVARLLTDTKQHGNGPLEGTLGLLRIEWSELREVDGQKES